MLPRDLAVTATGCCQRSRAFASTRAPASAGPPGACPSKGHRQARHALSGGATRMKATNPCSNGIACDVVMACLSWFDHRETAGCVSHSASRGNAWRRHGFDAREVRRGQDCAGPSILRDTSLLHARYRHDVFLAREATQAHCAGLRVSRTLSTSAFFAKRRPEAWIVAAVVGGSSKRLNRPESRVPADYRARTRCRLAARGGSSLDIARPQRVFAGSAAIGWTALARRIVSAPASERPR